MPESLPERLVAALADRYRIERPLGEGGMATVYLAHDVKHERQVAIKVLRPELAAVVGGDRFLSEIKTTANLQHPHILPLFDSGEADSFLFFVMPYIAGETLRDLLQREKQLPVDEAVRIARGVASALDYAHRHGVIHRDIKPANILLHDGEPVVADFGIALAVQHAGGGRLTETGLSLGTPFYMSPEQATGDRDPDARADLYSLGCVAYEMLAGEPPFTGSTAQSVLAKILTGDAPLVTQVRKAVPPHVAAAVLRATQRLPADRFATAGEFAKALEDPAFRYGAADGDVQAAGRATGGGGIWRMATAGLGLVSLLLLAQVVRSGRAQPDSGPLLLRVVMADSQRVVSPPDFASLEVSDDGSTIVYVGPAPGGNTQLWVKRRDEADPTPLRNTLAPLAFSVSPDGKDVAFVLQESVTLQVVPSAGGTARTVADTALALGLDWGSDGYIYFQSSRSGINRVPAKGGNVEALTQGLSEDGQRALADHAWPFLLPGGERLLLTKWGNTADSDSIAVLDLADGVMRIIANGVNAKYMSPGFLLMGSNDGNLMVAPFDADRGELTGPLRVVAGAVRQLASGGLDFNVSASGALTYVSGGGNRDTPSWVDMEGNATPVQDGWDGLFQAAALSPDGSRLAVSLLEGGRADIWVKRVDGTDAPPQRITFQGADVIRPTWLSGGDTVVYMATTPEGQNQILGRRWDGVGEPRVLLDAAGRGSTQSFQGVDVSGDGRWLVYRVGSGSSSRDIYAFHVGVDSVGRSLIATNANEHSPALSPDGRFLAYGSNESGSDEIYVRTFPDVAGGKWLVSAKGGREPVWAPDGRTLYYRNRNSDIMAARWDAEGAGGVLSRQVLFNAAGFYSDPVHPHYAISPDGKRFLMLKLEGNPDTGVIWIEDFVKGLASDDRR